MFHKLGDNCAGEQVSWNDCQKFMKKLAELRECLKDPSGANGGAMGSMRAGRTEPRFATQPFIRTWRIRWKFPYRVGKRVSIVENVAVGQFKPNAWACTTCRNQGMLRGLYGIWRDATILLGPRMFQAVRSAAELDFPHC
jgi:hypothetical protein